MLEVYLNVIEWGPGLYGAEAAARTHFGKGADALTRREAALLAAVLPSGYVSRRGEAIAGRMAKIGGYLGCLK